MRRFRFLQNALILSVGFAALLTAAAPTFTTFKDPASIEDFIVDWKNVANPPTGANPIVASNWTVPAGITQVSADFTTTRALVRLSGGTLKAEYLLTNMVTLTDGQMIPCTILIKIQLK